MWKILSVLNYKSTGGGGGWQNLYDMPKETVDVMFFGSSHAHCTFDHGLLWDEYGIAGYTLSAGAQMIDSTYYFVKEAIEVQNPKIVVLEVWGAVHDEIINDDASFYRNTLGMRWSKNHRDFVKDLSEHMKKDPIYKKQLLLKFPIIHSRYTEIVQDDFENMEPYMRGYRGSYLRGEFEAPPVISEENVLPLEERSEEYLRKIIDITKMSDTELILVAAPYCSSETERMRFNYIKQIATEEEIPMIDFHHLYEEIELDYDVDFRDGGHVNNYGAEKVTSYVADFLVNNYDLTDKRGSNKYILWDINSRFLEGTKIRKRLTDALDINEYLGIISELKDYMIIMNLNGNHTAAGDVYYPQLEEMGIKYDDYVTGGTWIFENGNVVSYLSGKEYQDDFEKNGVSIYLQSEIIMNEDGESYQKAKIILGKENYVMVENGVNILVYDPVTKTVIDSVATDIYVNFEIMRKENEEL
ncbi:MAG: hypothetical protein IKW30_09995 [Lachnospiraceae bacterium]|nr:hypothetical protein [Lachnospiraceae bacterium]